MKFCYCPDCKELHPRAWYGGRTCDVCQGDCAIIKVPTSIVGYLMYIFSVVALAFIMMNLTGTKWALSDYNFFLIFGAIIAAFVCAFIEIGRGTELAYERIQKKV